MKKVILHLCADTGSDTKPYADDEGYRVIRINKEMGVESFDGATIKILGEVYGVIANPVCTEFSTARSNGKARNPEAGMEIVRENGRQIKWN